MQHRGCASWRGSDDASATAGCTCAEAGGTDGQPRAGRAADRAEALSAREATASVPIAVWGSGLVERGPVGSLERLDGNVTGITHARDYPALDLAVQRHAVPGLTRLGVLVDPSYVGAPPLRREVERLVAGAHHRAERARQLPRPVDLHDGQPYAERRGEAVYALNNPVFARGAAQLADAALQSRLPLMAPYRATAQAGALLAFEPGLLARARRLDVNVARVLGGARPGDLPVEESIGQRFFANARTAAALGLDLPPDLLRESEEVHR